MKIEMLLPQDKVNTDPDRLPRDVQAVVMFRDKDEERFIDLWVYADGKHCALGRVFSFYRGSITQFLEITKRIGTFIAANGLEDEYADARPTEECPDALPGAAG